MQYVLFVFSLSLSWARIENKSMLYNTAMHSVTGIFLKWTNNFLHSRLSFATILEPATTAPLYFLLLGLCPVHPSP